MNLETLITEHGAKFLRGLRKLTPNKQVKIKEYTTTTKLAQEELGNSDYFTLINHYNRRVPKNTVEVGETIYLPNPQELETYINNYKIKLTQATNL